MHAHRFDNTLKEFSSFVNIQLKHLFCDSCIAFYYNYKIIQLFLYTHLLSILRISTYYGALPVRVIPLVRSQNLPKN